MENEFKDLRLQQLARSLSLFEQAKQEPRPPRGWLQAVRQALGLSLNAVGQKLKKPRQDILYFEKAEAEDRITLKNLRLVAEAMDCELVYAVVPKSGTIAELADYLIRNHVYTNAYAVERTMALENQAPGDIEKLVESETKRRRAK